MITHWKKSVFAILIVFISVAACRREKVFPNYKKKGIVYDSITNIGLEGVLFNIHNYRYHLDISLGGGGGGLRKIIPIEETISDKEGKWELKYHSVRSRIYYLLVNKVGYYPIQYRCDKDYDHVPENIKMVPQGKIRFTVEDDTTTAYNYVNVNIEIPNKIHASSVDNNLLTGGFFTYKTSCVDFPDTYTLSAIGGSYQKFTWTSKIADGCYETDSLMIVHKDSIWVPLQGIADFKIKL